MFVGVRASDEEVDDRVFVRTEQRVGGELGMITVKEVSVVGRVEWIGVSEEGEEEEKGMLKNDGCGKVGVMAGGLKGGHCGVVKEKK